MCNDKKSVAVMLCCFNRENKTKECLRSLMYQISEIENLIFDVYVYDDHSADGTLEMIRKNYPGVIVFSGGGNAYWCKSMHYLMRQTVKKKYNFYLMVNDDVKFYHDALKVMFTSFEKAGRTCGIVGSCRSGITGTHTYGGINKKGELILPTTEIQQCDIANWNCFLIDEKVIAKVGIIDGKYRHAFGDFDYSVRMLKKGIPIYIAYGYVGECEKDVKQGTFGDSTLPRRVRFKKLLSPKGLPLYSYMRYNFRVKGLRGLFVSFIGYASFIYYIVIGKDF